MLHMYISSYKFTCKERREVCGKRSGIEVKGLKQIRVSLLGNMLSYEVGGGVEASCIYIFTNAIALYKSVLVVGE